MLTEASCVPWTFFHFIFWIYVQIHTLFIEIVRTIYRDKIREVAKSFSVILADLGRLQEKKQRYLPGLLHSPNLEKK
jgi:hypothetical protein